jgi:Zn-dependent protease with chaperone function
MATSAPVSTPSNFFEQQAQAHSATNRLVILYILAVASITTVITMSFHLLFLVESANRADRYGQVSNPNATLGLDLMVALIVLAVIGLSSLIRMAQLGGSGEKVAELLGGEPVDPATKDPLERRLMNVVEEMSIASGIPVPRVYVLQHEQGINAFAAGLKPGQAVIGITRGTLEQLTRDELQGVVAHEFSHIFNGDMRLNLRLMGVLGGILVLATIGRLLFQVSPRSRSSSNDRSDGSALVIFGLVLFVLGYIGVFFARLIKAAVSRQREYLADASAVQYTRNSDGIGGALMKIRGFPDHSRIQSHFAEEASHMFFGSALNFSSVFATHPPLEDRIGRVAPLLLKSGAWHPREAMDETSAAKISEVNHLATDSLSVLASATIGFNTASRHSVSLAQSATNATNRRADSRAVADAVGTDSLSTKASGAGSAAAKSLLTSIGAPGAADIIAARTFLENLPEAIRARTRDRQGAVLLVISLFLESADGSLQQNAILSGSLGPDEVREVLEIRTQLASLAETDRLSLLELSLPPLRQLTDSSKEMLLKMGNDLAHADGEVDLYEYVALSLLEHQLMRDLRARKPKPNITSQRTSNDLSLVLSAIAYAGADDVPAAKKAFDSGSSVIQSSLGQLSTFRALDECKLELIADAIERLSYLEPGAQKKVIQACAQTIMFDGHVTIKESELLKALCTVLEAPLPALAI